MHVQGLTIILPNRIGVPAARVQSRTALRAVTLCAEKGVVGLAVSGVPPQNCCLSSECPLSLVSDVPPGVC